MAPPSEPLSAGAIAVANPNAAPPPPPDAVIAEAESVSGPTHTAVSSPVAAPAPPPPPQRPSSGSGLRPAVQPSGASTSTLLEQRLGTAQLELRKLGSERHTLRSRLRRESDRVQELESALRAEKELRRHGLEEHQSTVAGLRSRLASLESEGAHELAELREELAQAQSDAERAKADAARANAETARLKEQLATLQGELEGWRAEGVAPRAAATATSVAAAAKQLQGLRRIRGIGPAYQRVLEQLGVTKVQEVAAWTPADVKSFALKLKIKPERIQKDDWVGQAKLLTPD